jgi:hypothetical protein
MRKDSYVGSVSSVNFLPLAGGATCQYDQPHVFAWNPQPFTEWRVRELVVEEILFGDRRNAFPEIIERLNLFWRGAGPLPAGPIKRIRTPAPFNLVLQDCELESEKIFTTQCFQSVHYRRNS